MKKKVILLIIMALIVGFGVTKLFKSDDSNNQLNQSYTTCLQTNKELNNKVSNFNCVPKELEIIRYINITPIVKCNTTNTNWTYTNSLKQRVNYLERLTEGCFVFNESERNDNLTKNLALCNVEIDKLKDYVEDI